MLFGSYNNMNMFGMNNFFNMGNTFNAGSMFNVNTIMNYMYGGSNNIFGGNNFFGNGCSIFTNCNGTYNYEAMAGFAVGGTLLNGIGMFVSNQISEKKSNSIEKVETDISNMNDDIDAELDKLGDGVTEENYKDYSIDNDPKAEAVTTLEKEFEDNKVKIAAYDKTALEADVEKYKEAYKKDPKQENLSDLKTAADKAKKDLEELKKLEARQKTIEDKELPAAKKAKEARKKEIEDIKKTITNLIQKREIAQEICDDKVLDKADGKRWQQADYKDIIAKFNDDGSLVADAEITKADIRGAIAAYRTADPNNKEELIKYAKTFNQCWANMDEKDRSSTFVAARGIIPNEHEVKKMEAELKV